MAMGGARTMILGGLLALGAVTAGAQPPPPAAAPGVVVNPDWLRKPSGEDVAESYPKIAESLDIEGYSMLRCTVNPIGVLEACYSEYERPRELGFGTAAVSLAPRFRMRPQTLNGEARASQIGIPIRFQLPVSEPYADPAPHASPNALAMARRLVAMGKHVEHVMDTYDQQAAKIDFEIADQVPDSTRTAASKALREAARVRAADLAEAIAHVYAGVLTEAELQNELAYGETPAGRATVGDNPDLAAVRTMVERDTQAAVQVRAKIEFCKLRPCNTSGDLGLARDVAAKTVAIAHPEWAATPAQDDLYTATPKLAWTLGIGARARLTCTVAAQGALAGCTVAAEAPAGLGAGSGALKLAPLYRLAGGAGALGKTASVIVDFPEPEAPSPYDAPQAKSPRALALARQLLNAGATPDGEAKEAETMVRAGAAKAFVDGVIDPATREDAIKAISRAALAVHDEQKRQLTGAYAALLSEEQLAAAVTYIKSPTSRAVQGKQGKLSEATEALQRHFGELIADDAGVLYCKARTCEPPPPPGQAPPLPQLSGASAAPSTRTP